MAKVGQALGLILPCVAWANSPVTTQIEAIEAKLATTTVPAKNAENQPIFLNNESSTTSHAPDTDPKVWHA